MATKRHRLVLERLEQRQLLTANVWFEDSGQSLGTNTDGAQFGDLDGDSDLDVFVACRNWPGGSSCSETQVWLNNGSGQFSKGWSVRETNIGGLALGDLDHDGDLDVFLTKASPYGSTISQIWLNDGQGNFEDSGQRLNDIAFNVVLADVDSDGDWDAITAHPLDASKVWLNNGAGEFTNSGQRLVASMDIAMGDVDGDGDLDLYFARGVENSADLLYLNDGKGNFTDSGQRRLDPSFTNAVRLGDLDGDGDLDAFIANGNQHGGARNDPDRVYLNDGTGKFVDSRQRLGTALSQSVELADLDGDGDLDAFVANGVRHWGNRVDQANEIWLNDGSGVFTLGQEIGDAASYRVALGDIDNDGDLDAFIGNIGQDNQIWINTQDVPFEGVIQGIETSVEQFPKVFVDGSGTGNATHLGRFTLTYKLEVDLLTLPFETKGTSVFTAANGDSLFTDIIGRGTPTENPNVLSVEEVHTITGGTGRFAGATGSFIRTYLLSRDTGATSGSFDGTIVINTQPIQGSIQEVETTVDFQFPTAFQDGSASGNATHLGGFTATFEFEVDTRNFTGVGSFHFIAANGDSLFTDVVGLGTDPAVNPVSHIVETHTITGGTGRFAGATGSFTLDRMLNTVTGVSSGSFDGSISTPIAGDANRDGVFNQLDIVQVLQSAKYQTGQPATWAEGDFNGDLVFNQLDIVAALQSGKYGQS